MPCLDVPCFDPCSLFRSMLACLDLASCIFIMLHMLYSPFSICLFAPFVLFLSSLVASFTFVGCLDVTTCMRSYLDDVGMLVFLPLSHA